MRVLIAASIYPPDPGGPALHAKRQYQWYKEHGIKTEVVALAHFRYLPKVIRHLAYLGSLAARAFKYDVVYGHDAVGSGIPGLLAARMFSKKFVTRVGGDLAWEHQADKSDCLSMMEWYGQGKHVSNTLFKLSRWLLRRADLIVVPTKLLEDVYIKYYGVRPGNVKVIPNPIPDIPELEVKSGNTIVYASRLVAYKNLDLVLRVLARIFPQHPELKFEVMGDGPERDRLERLAHDLNIESKVDFLGTVPQKEVLERTAKCLFALAPALTEFNPNYILQAISLGKPFIISSENGLPFTLSSEYTFDARSEKELEERILIMLQNPKLFKTEYKMSWGENLRANLDAIESLV